MIYVTGDTHGPHSINKISKHKWSKASSLTQNDFVIILGDFGLIWSNPPFKEDTWWLNWLNRYPAKILFIDGNHENHDLLDAMPIETQYGGHVHRINDNVFHLMRGEIFTLPNDETTIKIFTFGGAASHDKKWRTEGTSWWPREEASQQEFEHACANLDKHDWTVDIVLTHDCPTHCKSDVLTAPRPYQLSDYVETSRWKNTRTNKFLNEIESKLDFKFWYFGHYHMDVTCQTQRHACLYRKIIQVDNLPKT